MSLCPNKCRHEAAKIRRFVSSWFLLSLSWTIVHVAAQQRTPAPTFRADTRLIVQAVVVKDRDGKPIEGLTVNDFVVTEDGVPQEVSFVEFQKIEHTPATPPAPVNRAPVGAGAPAAVAPTFAAPPGGDTRYRDRRLLVLYFDLTALPPLDLSRAYAAARKFVDGQMQTP